MKTENEKTLTEIYGRAYTDSINRGGHQTTRTLLNAATYDACEAVRLHVLKNDPVVKGLVELMPNPDENANVRFERIGAMYYADTGYLRPGKSDPEKDTASIENVRRFEDWWHSKCRKALSAHASALEGKG